MPRTTSHAAVPPSAMSSGSQLVVSRAPSSDATHGDLESVHQAADHATRHSAHQQQLPGLIRGESMQVVDDCQEVREAEANERAPPASANLSNSAFPRGNRVVPTTTGPPSPSAAAPAALDDEDDHARGGATGEGWLGTPACDEGLSKRIVSTAFTDVESPGDNIDDAGDKDSAPVGYGRLSSTSGSREGSENGGIIAEFAKGNKSIAMVASKDIKNRWLVSFSVNIFLEMFVIHIFGPLAIPYINHRYGWNAVKNLQLERYSARGGIGTWFWAFWVMMNFLYYTMPTPHITFSEVFIATCIFLARNCIIAAKYAYFSPGHLSDMTGRLLTSEEQAALLIVSGWHTPSPATIKSELTFAVKRTRVDIRHMYLGFQADDRAEQVAIANKLHASF